VFRGKEAWQILERGYTFGGSTILACWGEGYICAEEVLEDIREVREVDEMEERKDEIFKAV
jgi:putative lipase involved disintegration of autophagic bodies